MIQEFFFLLPIQQHRALLTILQGDAHRSFAEVWTIWVLSSYV